MKDKDSKLLSEAYSSVINEEDYSERDELIGMYSDMHKDIHGFRPRYIDWSKHSDDEIKQKFKELQKEYDEYIKAENQRIREDEADFDKEVEMMISKGAKDKKEAIEWILQADNVNPSDYWDLGYWVSQHGFSGAKEVEIRKILGV